MFYPSGAMKFLLLNPEASSGLTQTGHGQGHGQDTDKDTDKDKEDMIEWNEWRKKKGD